MARWTVLIPTPNRPAYSATDGIRSPGERVSKSRAIAAADEPARLNRAVAGPPSPYVARPEPSSAAGREWRPEPGDGGFADPTYLLPFGLTHHTDFRTFARANRLREPARGLLVEPVTPLSIPARLDLLESSGTTTATATRLARRFHRTVAEQFAAPEDALVERLITHIAMALTRVERGEPEADLPEVAAAELDSRVAERKLAAGYCDQWEAELGRSIPQSERDYLAVYLAALSDAQVQ